MTKLELITEIEEVRQRLDKAFKTIQDILALEHSQGMQQAFMQFSQALTLVEDGIANVKSTLPPKTFEIGQQVKIPRDVTRGGGRGKPVPVAYAGYNGVISQLQLNEVKQEWRYRVAIGGALGFWTDGSEIEVIDE